MIFDYTIGNPPYQAKVGQRSNGLDVFKRIFDKFHEYCGAVSSSVVMIYPTFWMNNVSKGHGAWLVDNGLMYANSYYANEVFKTIMSTYRIGIVLTQKGYDGLIDNDGVLFKRDAGVWLGKKQSAILFERTYNYKKLDLQANHITKLSSMESFPDVPFSDERKSDEDIAVFIKETASTRQDGAIRYAPRDEVIPEYFSQEHVDEYTVAMPQHYFVQARSFNTVVDNPRLGFETRVFPKGCVFGRTYIRLAGFDTLEEAQNFSAYFSSYVPSSLTALNSSKASFASHTPDLGDYTNNNPDIDWDQPLDQQLYKLFCLSDQDIEIMEQC